MIVERRNFLRKLLQLAALASCVNFPANAQKKVAAEFLLGVASGSPAIDGATIWTRLIASDVLVAPALVVWEVAEDESFKKIAAKGKVTALPELAHSVHVDLRGLQPDRWYWYRFMAGDAVSETGRTRTLPELGKLPPSLRLAYASCQRWEDGFYAAYRHMSREALDMVVFVGDYIYEVPPRKGRVRIHSLDTARSLDGYRQRYALYKSDPDLQRMHASCPWLITWDDHELESDYAAGISTNGDSDFANRRLAAYQAFYEHMPLSTKSLVNALAGLAYNDGLRLYDRFHFGQLACIHLLDDRQYRSPPLCPREPEKHKYSCASVDGIERTMLGFEQELWLDEGFRESVRHRSRWNVIAQQTAFSPRRIERDTDVITSRDSWDGYAPGRRRLLDSIVKHKSENNLFIGGDIHQNWVAHVRRNPADDFSAIVGAEFCGTSIASRSGSSQKRTEKIARQNPHCVFANSERRGYGVMEITPGQCNVSLKALDDASDRNSGAFTLARFQVDAGNPKLRKL
jgi:alkaline phosphatase D